MRLPLNERCLYYVVFLPILGRSFFPQVRDANSITFQSSFSDPQILGVYALWGYCLYLFLRNPSRLKGLFAAPLWPLTAFILVTVASSIVVSAAPLYSLWRSIEACGVLLWGALVLTDNEKRDLPNQLYLSFYTMTAVMLVGVVASMIIDPEHAWMNDDSGVKRLATTSTFMMGANSIGVAAAVLSLSALARFICFLKPHYLGLFGGGLALCYAARSRTGFIVFALGASLLITYTSRMPSRRIFISICCALLGVLIIGLLIVSADFANDLTSTFTRGHTEKNIKSLDGRVSIWSSAVKAFEISPFLGSGYATYPMRIEAGGHFHNMFIELAVTTGLAGLIPILILFLLIVSRLWRVVILNSYSSNEDQKGVMDGLAIAVVIIISELTTAGAAYYSWHMIGVVVLAVGLYTMPDRSRAGEEDFYAIPWDVPSSNPAPTEVEARPLVFDRKTYF